MDPPTGVCLVVAGGLTQDLTLILSTKNTKQNKEKKTQARIHLLQKKWRGIHCEEYMLCVTASSNILENANREEDMLCVTTAELHEELQGEDMLCFTASLIVKKIKLCTFKFICCVLLSMCLSKTMPPVPSPEPGGFV